MDEFETDEAAELPHSSATSPRWTGKTSIALAHRLNDQCVELLCELATNSSSQELPPFVLQNRDQWRLLEVDARKRVAAFPFVIVDLRFKHAESWQRAADGHLMSATDFPLFGGVPPKLFEDLILETLLFARQTACLLYTSLFTRYAYPAQLAACILLVASVAAIVLTLRRRSGGKPQDIAKQVAVRAKDRVRIVKMASEKRS